MTITLPMKITPANADDDTEVTVTMPLRLLWQAHVAYGDDGSNDDEHDLLVEACDLIAEAAGTPDGQDWELVVVLHQWPDASAMRTIEHKLPDDLREEITIRPDGEPSDDRYRLTVAVEDKSLGVARAIAAVLAKAVEQAGVAPEPEVWLDAMARGGGAYVAAHAPVSS